MGFYSYMKKIVNYSLVIIIQFCHQLIIHDEKNVITNYFMPRHQTFDIKAKTYKRNLMNKINRNPSILGRLSVIK